MGSTTVKMDMAVTEECEYHEDLALALAASSGDSVARRDLVLRIIDRIRRISYKMTGGGPDADELAQIACIEVLTSIGSYKGIGPLDGWALKIATRVIWAHMKKIIKLRSVTAESDLSTISGPGISETNLDNKRAVHRIEELLREMDPKFGLTVILKSIQGHSIDEISEITDTTKNTVRERLRVGRKKLSAKMENDPLLSKWRLENVK